MLAPALLDELDGFLLDLNAASAAVSLPLFRGDHDLQDKGGAAGFDPVTAADKGAEAAIRKLIGERYPEHGVIGDLRTAWFKYYILNKQVETTEADKGQLQSLINTATARTAAWAPTPTASTSCSA